MPVSREWTPEQDALVISMWPTDAMMADIARIVGCDPKTVWRRGIKLGMKPRKALPVPADFAEKCVTALTRELAARHKVSDKTILKWVSLQSPEIRAERDLFIAYRITEMRQAANDRRFGGTAEERRATRNERLRQQRAEQRDRRSRQAKAGGTRTRRPQPIEHRDGGIDALAIDHLRRASRYRPVCKAETIYGKAHAGIYVVGRLKVDRDGLLAMAVKHGWQPDAWRQVA